MNKTLRLLILFAIVMLFCLSTASVVFASSNIPAATSDFYVNDFADVFTQEEKANLITNAVNHANECNGVQVVVTTIKSLEGDTIENYAYQMYNQYGIGKDDMGLLILLATDDRQIRVEVGRAMESYINDAKAGRFIDKYAILYLKENKFNEGLISLQQAFIKEIKSCVTSEGTTQNSVHIDTNIDWGVVLLVIIITVATGGFIWLVIFAVNKARKKRQKKQEYIQSVEDSIKNREIRIEDLKSRLANLQSENTTLEREKNRLKEELSEKTDSLEMLENRHKRILAIYPDADKKVDDMIEAEKIAKAKARASEVDRLIESVINLQPDKDLVGRLVSIKHRFDLLSSDESKYLESDVNRFNALYCKCCELKIEYEQAVEKERRRRVTEERKAKAQDITKQLLGIISVVGIAQANDLYRLKEAKALYDNLDKETRSYVDSSTISKIEELLKRAKRAKEQQEEEERRRRQALNNSISSSSISSSSRSSFGGFGGRSGGGGASRKF